MRLSPEPPDLVTADYQYGNVGQVTAILENNATNLVSFGYGAFGRRNSLTRPNGVTTTYGYDPVSRLTSLAQDLAGTAYDQTLTFAYSPASQVTNRTTTNVAYAWPRLFTVDRPYGVNGLNQLTSAASAPISYDARGNLVNDNSLTYGYDVENHLTNVSNGEALVYDPLGRLYQTTNGSGAVTRYLYAGAEIIGELDGANTLLRRYVHGPGTDEPLVLYPSASTATRQWLIADQQGSIVAVTDATGNPLTVGSARAINTYDDYGVPGTANYGLYGYTGQIWLADIGLNHYKARAYSPVLGRFLQTDPVGYKDGPNWYAYVANDPVNKTDPSGNSITEIGFLIYDVATTVDHVAHGASWGTLAGDALNIGLDVEPVPGLREVKGAVEIGRAVEHGVEASRVERAVEHGLPKPPSGPGSVPRSERDPRRTFSPSERTAQREAQGGKCANGCGTKIDASNSNGHHIDRHADGGRTDQPNHAEVCIDCHKKLHSPD